MTVQLTTVDFAEPTPSLWRRHGVTIGRIVLIAALIGLWKLGADRAGPIYIADPLKVAQRIVTDTQSGELLRHIYVTVRLSLIGFAIGCGAGIVFPFVLRLVPRISDAIEPYIMASVGIPKYALIPLFILYFGIDDAPKLWLIGLLVFYPIFIAVFAGIRSVDRRLINMARIAGAGEFTIAREVIWNSLLPFFFAALKISLPRAISAAVIGEFLVGNEGLGYLIEHSRQNFDTVGVFEGIVVATALVLILNVVLVWLDKRINGWRPTDRHMEL
jgi:ABC-type nitrate/sulfonate/bicarbonate transport system permease component